MPCQIAGWITKRGSKSQNDASYWSNEHVISCIASYASLNVNNNWKPKYGEHMSLTYRVALLSTPHKQRRLSSNYTCQIWPCRNCPRKRLPDVGNCGCQGVLCKRNIASAGAGINQLADKTRVGIISGKVKCERERVRLAADSEKTLLDGSCIVAGWLQDGACRILVRQRAGGRHVGSCKRVFGRVTPRGRTFGKGRVSDDLGAARRWRWWR